MAIMACDHILLSVTLVDKLYLTLGPKLVLLQHIGVIDGDTLSLDDPIFVEAFELEIVRLLL
jgi:hypothetical protein